jgi:hypothetical protein
MICLFYSAGFLSFLFKSKLYLGTVTRYVSLLHFEMEFWNIPYQNGHRYSIQDDAILISYVTLVVAIKMSNVLKKYKAKRCQFRYLLRLW